MRKYVSVYQQLLKVNFAALTAYRANFINSVISSLAWGFFSLYSIVVLTSRVNSAYGWRREELLFLNGMYGIIVGIFHMFLSINMRRFSRVIHHGELDFILAKPIDPQFAMSLWLVDYTMILRIIMAFLYATWIATQFHLGLSFAHLILMGVFSLASLLLLYSLWFAVLTILIWFTNLTNLVVLMFSFESLARFPREMSWQLASYFLFIVFPLTLVVNTPARAYLGRLEGWEGLVLIGIASGLFILARTFWRFALRYYTSASS
ncbi:MAG: ABC transporter permease [Patescibacteria group bacterium]